MPTIPLGIAIRFDDFLALFLIPFVILTKPNFKTNRLFFSYLLILLSFITSTFYGYLFLKVPFSIRDINELFRMIKPFLIIIAVSYCNLRTLVSYLNSFFKVGAILLILLGFLEFFNVLSFRALFYSLYGFEFGNMGGRSVLTAGNPNIASALVLYFMIYFLQRMLLTGDRILSLFKILFLLVVLLMTSSRTALIVFVVVLLASMYFHRKHNKILSIVIITFCALLTFPLLKYFDYLTIGFVSFSDGTNTSMLIRYQQWSDAINLFKQSPIIGWGPAKDLHTSVVDNEYFLLLRRYGILGIVFVINFLFSFIFVFLKRKRQIDLLDVRTKSIAYTTLLSLLMVFIIMITNNFFSGYQLMPLYIVMIAITEGSLKIFASDNKDKYE
jgi:O-antigen ligase